MRLSNKMERVLMSIMTGSAMLLAAGCTSSDIKAGLGQGNAVAVTNTRLAPTDPSQVKIYYSKHGAPKHYTIIGQVSAAQFNVLGLPYSQESIAIELKKQAASLGANAVMDIKSSTVNITANAVVVKGKH